MADIFWITGFEIKDTQSSLLKGLESAGIRPSWIELAHSIMDPADQPSEGVWNEFQFVYHWQPQSILGDFVLHDACRSLAAREQNLILLVEKEGDSFECTLLASPQAVGRFNLMPHAHIAAWWTLPPATLTGLPQRLEKSGFDRDCVQWVNGGKEMLEQAQIVFPDIQAVDSVDLSTVGRFNSLIRRLDESKCSHGFLLAGTNDSPLLATLVER
jgi:hypothetical protein